jgi:AcrR family transcriptional regulator
VRRSVGVGPEALLASVAAHGTDDDEATTRILDAAADLFTTIGVRRCSIEDIADRSGVGRTTVYRRFGGRQQIVEAVLAREVHRFFGSILASTAHIESFDDVVVESFLGGMRASEASLLSALVRSEPELLQLMTIDAGPVLAAARQFLVAAYSSTRPGDADLDDVAIMAEVIVRLAMSLVLTPDTVLPLDDEIRAREVLHRLLDPLIAQIS